MSDQEDYVRNAAKSLKQMHKLVDDAQREGIIHIAFNVSPLAAKELIKLYETLVKIRG